MRTPDRTRQVLVVDDDPIIRKLIVTVARKAGYSTSEASDGAEALSMIEEQSFDLLVLDLMLPTLSGQEVLDRLDPERGCLVILVTAADDHNLDQIDSRFICDVVRKPFDIHELEKAISKALEERLPADDPSAAAEPRLHVKRQDSVETGDVPVGVEEPDSGEESAGTEVVTGDD